MIQKKLALQNKNRDQYQEWSNILEATEVIMDTLLWRTLKPGR